MRGESGEGVEESDETAAVSVRRHRKVRTGAEN